MPTKTTELSEERLAEARAAADKVADRPRRVELSGVEVRAKEDGGFTFEGLAAVFDELSEDLGGFREIIKRGAFKDVLDDDVRFLYNHNPDYVLARNTSGSLELEEKPTGLATVADVAPVSYADDIRVLIERGDVSGMSFAFRVAEDSWAEDDDENLIRTVHKFERLFDVSVVTYPAYPQTDAAVRAIEKLRSGETPTAEERGAMEALLVPRSSDTPPGEHEVRAETQEPDHQADGEPGRVVEENTPEGGLSGRSARVRLRALIARL